MIMLQMVNNLNIKQKLLEKHHKDQHNLQTKKMQIHQHNQQYHVEVNIPLKYLSNFWRFLDLPLINCET